MKKTYVGVGNVSKAVSNLYVGVGGTARKVVKAYVGDRNGLARMFFEVDEGIISFTGRKIYRHKTLPGSVIEYNEFGEDKKIFVFDAAYRAAKYVYASNTTVRDLPYADLGSEWGVLGFSYKEPDHSIYKDQLTDAYFNQVYADKLKPVLLSAKYVTDLMVKASNYNLTYAAHWCRAKGEEIGIEGQLPNAYQCLVMYAEGDYIDSLDPTLAANPTYALGWNNGLNKYRFHVGARYGAWTNLQRSGYENYYLNMNGNFFKDTKNTTRGIIPIAEL